jgi:hypothetical protein
LSPRLTSIIGTSSYDRADKEVGRQYCKRPALRVSLR